MWPFRTKNRDQPAEAKTTEVIPLTRGHGRIFFSDRETEVIPRLTRDMPDTKLFPIVEDGPLEIDDQNLADWEAELAATPGLEEARRLAKAKLERLPSDDPMLSTDHLPETFWAISREGDHRVYRTPGGIKSALTQLNWHEDGEVWKGVVYWHPVTSDYVDRPTA